MEVTASAKYIRISPIRTRLVVDMIRGKKVEEALGILSAYPQKAARVVLKLLKSAVADAGQTSEIEVDALCIKRIDVNEGPTIKRWRARAMGRATRIHKKTSHLTVTLEEM